MAIGLTFFIVAALVIGVYLVIEVKRLKHKLFAMFLIGLILFTYISFTVSLKGQDIDFGSVDGLIKAGKLYWSWLGTIFLNTKSITAYVFKQDWKSYNKSVLDEPPAEIESIWDKL